MTATQADADEINQLWQDFKASPDNLELRNRLVEHYLRLVNINARRLWNRLPEGVEVDDLISAGIFGLVDAIDSFDLSREIRFETFCVMRIRGAMLDELRKMDWVPRLVRSKATKLADAAKRFAERHGRQPTDVELAEQMGLSIAELEKTSFDAHAVSVTSLHKERYQGEGANVVYEIDSHEDPKSEDPTRRNAKKDLMRLVTKGLNRNERLIIILYYYEELTMKEIGETLSLSESRVSQMHSSILERLKSQLGPRRSEFQMSGCA